MAQPAFEPSPLAPRRTAEEESRDRDLGFGSVVSRESRQRLLNRDGSFNVARSGLGFLESFAPYPSVADDLVDSVFSAWSSALLPHSESGLRGRLPGVRARCVARGRIGDARSTIQPGVLLQHPDLRHDWVRADRPERPRRQPRGDASKRWWASCIRRSPRVCCSLDLLGRPHPYSSAAALSSVLTTTARA